MRRFLLAATVGCVIVSNGPVPAADEPVIEFIRPQHLSTAVGVSRIELAVSPPVLPGPIELLISVDGAPLTTLREPPWVANWDAGTDGRAHELHAELRAAGQSVGRAVVRTSALRIHEVTRVSLVNLFPIVTDRSGRYVGGLTANDFRVYEDDRPQEISRFTVERVPLRVTLVLDTSASMTRGRSDKLREAKRGALGFLSVLGPQDEVAVLTFDDSVRVVVESTSDRAALTAAIEDLEAQGGTALYDAIWRGADALRGFEGRRVLVLLSDGKDEAYDGLGPGSLHTLREALDEALRREVIVYAIGLGSRLERDCAYSLTPLSPGVSACPEGTVAEILERIATATGGRALISPGASRLRNAFEEVANELRNQYAIAYSSDNPKIDGGWREIRVALKEREAVVRCRRGYYERSTEASGASTR